MSQSIPSNITDEQIAAIFAVDRNRAVGLAFHQYRRLLLTTAAHWAGWQNAEDAVQEAALNILKSESPVWPNGDKLVGWLCRCVKNAATTLFRKQFIRERTQHRSESMFSTVEPEPSPDKLLAMAESGLVLLKLIDEVLTGFEWELARDDLTNVRQEVKIQAAKFGKSVGNINVVRSKYKRKLHLAAIESGWTRDIFF